jgi:hypothetical protein
MSSRGETQLDKHLSGKRITRGNALLAKCCECMNRYVDGRAECHVPKCPCYPYSPYREGSGKAGKPLAPHDPGPICPSDGSEAGSPTTTPERG